MKYAQYFDRLDIFKAIALVVLIGLLIGAVLAAEEVTGGSQAVEPGEETGVEEMLPPTRPGAETDLETGETPETEAPEGETSPESVPPAPAAQVVLIFRKEDKTLVTEDGVIMYVLSRDGRQWVPAIPENLEQMVGRNQPELGAGEIWVIYAVDMGSKYLWDPIALIWVREELAQALPETPPQPPGTSEPPAATETEPPTTEPSTPTEAPGDASAGLPEPNLPVPPPPETPASYTVRAGEFVYCIARRYNLNPYQLAAYNGLGANALVFGGTKLRIPANADPFPGRRWLQAHPTWYEVQQGDTLNSIACLFGDVHPESIAYANRLEAPYGLSVGQMLYIP